MKRTHQSTKISAIVKAAVEKINRDPNNSKRAMTATGRALTMRRPRLTGFASITCNLDQG